MQIVLTKYKVNLNGDCGSSSSSHGLFTCSCFYFFPCLFVSFLISSLLDDMSSFLLCSVTLLLSHPHAYEANCCSSLLLWPSAAAFSQSSSSFILSMLVGGFLNTNL